MLKVIGGFDKNLKKIAIVLRISDFYRNISIVLRAIMPVKFIQSDFEVWISVNGNDKRKSYNNHWFSKLNVRYNENNTGKITNDRLSK